MAPKKSSEQPDMETKLEPEPKPNQEQEAGDDLDPAKSIKKIRTIVETLHTLFPPQPVQARSQSQTGQLRKYKSSIPPPKSNNQKVTLTTVTSAPVETSSLNHDESENSIHKLKRNLRLLEEDVAKLRVLNEVVGEEVSRHIVPLDKLLQKVEKGTTKTQLTKGMKKDLEDVNKKIFNLMCQVPLLPNRRRKPGGLDSEDGEVENNGKGIECLPAIHANEEDLKRLAVFRQVKEKFMELSTDRKICLLSFAVFPENQEVNRTMLMYWWIGEGILSDGAKPEDAVKEILKEFMEKKLIEPVENKHKVEPNCYKMSPFVHSSVVLISEEIGLFSMYQKGKKPRMKHSDLKKVCLVEESSSQPEAKAKKMPAGDIETVFNVSERFPDFAFKWFSEDQSSSGKKKKFSPLTKTSFKMLKVFYLGRWERTANRHIEVENPDLMKYLKHMTKLKLLSFQGISRIERLDDAVCKLHDLIILDLRACYNIEKLPDKIDSLKALTYLDITDCYMIDRMPKRLSWLDNLEVLKGFVVSDATDEETFCLLSELKHLKKLRKLSITINKGGDFTVAQLFVDIQDFSNLEKLKVAWGGINEHNKAEPSAGAVKEFLRSMTRLPNSSVTEPKVHKAPKKVVAVPSHLPEKLMKLDLQCFPDAELPSLLEPGKLKTLEKLYIKGGTKLTGLGKSVPEEPTECSVKVLRLKFLPRLKVEWRELRELYFPKLEFLDKYQCPHVSFCPCDGIGIWRHKSYVKL
ncbi:RNI-like superfamily protein [Raphanus sativus]|uniref:Disease resistance RPP13-like protein 4 n=1 Tax=Raphanus sativus TaxID=3726 RepID=A0A6J0K1Z5_RAPSA|nr:disease resistance RPP13-like protein 4 [Raphanus sativus]XP_018441030.1 disease resistance RPP13-like protein 4 [Raphanus sativus]KAJ4888695.1 RNI-like superfamily protein [Raphanus sativus]